MNIEKLTKQLIKHEGERLKPYRCTAGKLTIGIGRNLEDKGITKEESRYLCENNIYECFYDLRDSIFQNQFDIFPEDIQHVLIDMRFQLGHNGFRKFKKMISTFQRLELDDAVKEMKDSRWYRQTPTRAKELIETVKQYVE
ncbi:MAG: lysozyme [Desulfobacterales bacterium]|nr:lysozyme [Desulfobacterales bacterium]